MALMSSNGFPVHVIDPSNVQLIYNTIENYIENANKRSGYSPNTAPTNPATDSELVILDNFANEILGNNKVEIVNKANEKQVFGFNEMKNQLIPRKVYDDNAKINEFRREGYKPGKSINITDLLTD